MILAGIVTYNPEILRLRNNIDSILPQVLEVVIFDNGSDNYSEIVVEFGDSCTIIDGNQNHGIAYGLNAISEYAYQKDYSWILTLDQDSVCDSQMASVLCTFQYLNNTAILCPRIIDRNLGEMDVEGELPYNAVDSCITSGSLVNLQVWKKIGGYWDDLFIDMVDFDFCWKAIENGYNIYRVRDAVLYHEMGSGRSIVFHGHNDFVLNHNHVRLYYIIRNTIIVGKFHDKAKKCLMWNFKTIYLVLRYETDRIRKTRYMIKGMIDGLRSHLGPLI